MKKLKLIGLVLGFTLINGVASLAQSNEYKLDMNSGKLIVKEIAEVTFVGYSGSEVIIKNLDMDSEKSERAKGLKLINGLGLEDNTGIGINVNKEGGNAVINQIARNDEGEFEIKVPKGVTIVYEQSSVYGDEVILKDISGEIEVTTNHSDVELINVTGPLTINTVHGDIEGNFSDVSQGNPLSIVSTHGDIDLGIPSTTKSNFEISTSWGEIYSDLDIKIERGGDDKMKRYSMNKVIGTMNGGGVSFKVKSTHGSVYLRKK